MDTHPLPISADVIERDGCRLHFWLSGPEDRPLVVLTHGMALDHHMFDQQVPILASDYRVLTWDLRGHGQSQPTGAPFTISLAVDDLLAIMYHIGRQRAVFVGHSLGGIVAQELAFRFPARVAGLVAFGCSCITLPVGRPLALAQQLMPLPLHLMRFVPHWPLLRLGIAQMAVRPEVRAQAANMASQMTRSVFLHVIAALATSRHGQPSYRMTRPLLLVYGERDRFGSPQRAARAWAARDRQAQIVAIPNAGHNVNQDHPDAFNARLCSFLHTHLPILKRETA